MTFTIATEMEQDGRWIAEIQEIPGALVYGTTQEEAVANVKALALRVLADKIEKREAASDVSSVTFGAA